jgi:hypothetical protein
MNNLKKQLSGALAFFLITSCAIAEDHGASQEAESIDPVKQIEELRKEAELFRDRGMKAPPQLSKKLFEIAQTNEKIAVMCEKKIRAIKQNDQQKTMQIQRDLDKTWVVRASCIDESRKEHKRFAGYERDRLREQARSREGKKELVSNSEKVLTPDHKKMEAYRDNKTQEKSTEVAKKTPDSSNPQEWPAYE